MAMLTPVAACLVFAAVIVLAVIITYASTPTDARSRAQIFLTTLASMGIFITFMFYFNVVALQEMQQDLNVIEQTSNINASITDTYLSEVRKAAPLIPAFTLSLMPLSPFPSRQAAADDDSAVACIEKFVLSYKIFTIWQEFIIAHAYIYVDAHAYVNGFLQRASSAPLRDMWTRHRADFDSEAIAFGDLLFEYAATVRAQTSDEYVRASRQLVADPRYKTLITRKKSWLFS